MLRNIYFWVATTIFIVIVGVSAFRFIPPELATLQDEKSKLSDLNSQINDEKQFAAAVDTLAKNKDQLASLANLSQEALPDKPDGEELSLQLDGMFSKLGLSGVTATVPYGSSATGSGNSLSITATGPLNFGSTKTLLVGLRQLIRWNKVTSFSLSQTDNTAQASVTFNVFYKPGKVNTFSGNNKLLDQANTLLSAFHSYTTRPNAEVEGTYGRTDPFTAPQ